MPSATASLKVTYIDTECSSLAAYVYLVDVATCSSSGSEAAACHVSTDSSAAIQSFCSPSRNASISATFQGEPFLGYDIFTDAECADYVSSYVYLVGPCLSLGSDSSAKAALVAGDGSATFQSFKDSASCDSDDYTQFSVTQSALKDAECVHYGGSRYYHFFASVAVDATDTGSSATGSSTASSSTGAASAATASTSSSRASESDESTASSASATASTSASDSSSGSSSDSSSDSSSALPASPTNATLTSSSSSSAVLTPTSSSTPTPSATLSSSPTSTGLGTAAIIGIVAGAAIVAAIALVLVMCCRRRRFKTEKSSDVQVLEDAAVYFSKRDKPGDATLSSSDPSQPKPAGASSLWEDDAIVSWRVPRDKVLVGPLISRGGCGEVYRGSYNGQDVAIKMLPLESRRSVPHVNAFLAEAKLMAALDHPRVVQTVGVAWDSFSDLCVLSEFMAGGDLRALLASWSAASHPQGFDRTKLQIALHVAHALTYLHSLPRPVLHRDLKSKNVLLTPALEAKLADFGVSRERADRTMTAGVGTSLWMAPEVMIGDRYGDKADMFSFGVLLSELDTLSLPYAHATEGDSKSGERHRLPDAAVLQMVAMGSLRVEFSAGAMREVVEMGVACVSVDPAARPTAAEALGKLHSVLQRIKAVDGGV